MILSSWRALLLAGGAWAILAQHAGAADIAFTTYPFAATGTPTPRTLPDRLAEIKNVRDFGAVGNGVADDLDAIMAALNWTIATQNRGTVYFPPGVYYVRAPIDFSALSNFDSGPFVHFVGEMGLSTVVGDFADYVFKRALASTPRWSGGHFIEKLAIINRHAGGGGIRLGVAQACYIRDCDVTADIAINDDNTDTLIDGGNLNGAFELVIENCNCRPFNLLATGSAGLYKLSDGPVTNCTFIGFDLGMGTASGQGGAAVNGCYFEGNNIGFATATGVEAWSGGGGQLTVSGCHFKNNGTAIYKGGTNANFRGVRIEAAAGTIPGNPQYGIRILGDALGTTTFQGVFVTGEYAQAGVSVQGMESTKHNAGFTGIRSINSAGPDWDLPATAMTATYDFCNVAPVFTVLELPAINAPITSVSWAASGVWEIDSDHRTPGSGYVNGFYSNVPLTGGSGSGATANFQVGGGQVTAIDLASSPGAGYTSSDVLGVSSSNLGGSGSGFSVTVTIAQNMATVNFSSSVDVSNLIGKVAYLTIAGVTPSGYNGISIGKVRSGTRIIYPLASDPGGSGGAAGSIFFYGSDRGITKNVYEGDTYNVSDANTATWGAAVNAGGGSNHCKLRLTPQAWTVVGK